MVSKALYPDVPSREDLIEAIKGWEESVKWIASGWDCEDEYRDDLSYREMLDEVIDRYTSLTPLSKKLRRRIFCADEKFKQVTEPSHLCIWHMGPKFDWIGKDIDECLTEYDPERYWYYYRWPPNAPYPFRKFSSLEYQKEIYGLDFGAMAENALREVQREWTSTLYEICGKEKEANR